MDIRDLMELGDFVQSSEARHPTMLELTTKGLLIVTHATDPSTLNRFMDQHRLTAQQVHDYRLPEVREVVTDLWRRIDSKIVRPEIPIRASKPVCKECRGTGLAEIAGETGRGGAEFGTCDGCGGRGWTNG